MGQGSGIPKFDRLRGKKVFLQGKFERGERERLAALVQLLGGGIAKALVGGVDYVVVPDAAVSQAIERKTRSLNAKGAAIQILDADAFRTSLGPTAAQLVCLIKAGKRGRVLFSQLMGPADDDRGGAPPPPRFTFVGEDLRGSDLSGFDFGGIAFEKCRFAGAKLTGATFGRAVDCGFAGVTGTHVNFENIDRSRFAGARLSDVHFSTHLADTDFAEAVLENAAFDENFWASRVSPPASKSGPNFARAVLRQAQFDGVWVDGPNFEGADLAGASFKTCHFNRGRFRNAIVEDACLVACDLVGADLTGAKLVNANLGEADLTNARLDRADLAGCNLRGAKLKGATLSKARNLDPASMAGGKLGPSLKELDRVANGASKLKISFRVRGQGRGQEHVLDISCYGGRNSSHSAHLWLPDLHDTLDPRPQGIVGLSRELLQAGRVLGHLPVLFGRISVQSTKSPLAPRPLRELLVKAIAEAFGQPLPAAKALADETKMQRAQIVRQEQAAARKKVKTKQAAQIKINAQIARTVGKVTDIATFLKALELRIEKPKIDKATKMLKAERFKLFNDIGEEAVSGVVKSQTDPDLVYACRIEHDGHYACCTQNLNICGGLRGSVCKHLLVLIIGLVKAGELDPTTIDGWIAKSHDKKAELDKEAMGAIFIKYKGAEAGEVDWRPTETLPEDYYSL